MASILETSRLLKRVVLAGYTADEGLAITPLLSGQHGVGKSQIVKSVAKSLGGTAFTVEGGSLSEGEITGLPFAMKSDDGSSEVRFVKYYQINNIWKLEKYYYEKALTTGFLDGELKLTLEEVDSMGIPDRVLTYKGEEISRITAVESIALGSDNQFKFMESIPADLKLRLIETGEVKPVVLFIDEINRTEQQTMKQLMNIILNKNVNGYSFPWFVSVVSAINPCSQNSSYATNEMDDAQTDRFLKIKVNAKLDEWVDYALDKGINSEIVRSLSVNNDIFLIKDKSYTDDDPMKPSPRSWEMVAHIYNTLYKLNNSRFFTSDERKKVDEDFYALAAGKVGETAARTLIQTLQDRENTIKPEEILNGKSNKVNPEIMNKFKNQKKLAQMVITTSTVNWLWDNLDKIAKGKTSVKEEEKKYYTNLCAQLSEFIGALDQSLQVTFVKKVLKSGDTSLYSKISSAFSGQVLQTIAAFKRDLDDITR